MAGDGWPADRWRGQGSFNGRGDKVALGMWTSPDGAVSGLICLTVGRVGASAKLTTGERVEAETITGLRENLRARFG